MQSVNLYFTSSPSNGPTQLRGRVAPGVAWSARPALTCTAPRLGVWGDLLGTGSLVGVVANASGLYTVQPQVQGPGSNISVLEQSALVRVCVWQHGGHPTPPLACALPALGPVDPSCFAAVCAHDCRGTVHALCLRVQGCVKLPSTFAVCVLVAVALESWQAAADIAGLSALLLADVAGEDYLPELVVLSGGRLTVLQPPNAVTLPFLPATITSVAAADLDGNGRVDLVVTAPGAAMYLVRAAGTVTPASGALYAFATRTCACCTSWSSLGAGASCITGRTRFRACLGVVSLLCAAGQLLHDETSGTLVMGSGSRLPSFAGTPSSLLLQSPVLVDVDADGDVDVRVHDPPSSPP